MNSTKYLTQYDFQRGMPFTDYYTNHYYRHLNGFLYKYEMITKKLIEIIGKVYNTNDDYFSITKNMLYKELKTDFQFNTFKTYQDPEAIPFPDSENTEEKPKSILDTWL